MRMKPHIQRSARIKSKASITIGQLVRRQPQIQQYAINPVPSKPAENFSRLEIAAACKQAVVARQLFPGKPQHHRVTVHPNQPPCRPDGLQDQAAVTSGTHSSVQHCQPRRQLQPLQHFSRHNGDVDRTNVPVLVKVSYFPNWRSRGASAPLRAAPNMMVVIPTSTHVTLSYQPSTLDNLSYVLTFAGVLVVVWFARRRFRYGVAMPARRSVLLDDEELGLASADDDD